MRKKILIVIYIILLLTTFKLLYNIAINSVLLNKYNDGKYDKIQAKALTYLNFSQRYIANYNYGNILYQNGEYESAIEEYKKALNGFAPKYKRCNIRINHALAICKTVQFDEKEQDSIKKAIETYESAIDILTEEGCANKNDNNGHNQKAEQLKKDIRKEIDRLKKMQKSEGTDESDEEEKENQETKNSETIEAQIQDIKENATKEQRQLEKQFKDYNKNINTGGRNW